MPVMTSSGKHTWWAELRHSGMVLAPALLEEFFPDGPVEPKWHSYQRLRDRYTTFESWAKREDAYEQGSSSQPLNDWLNAVLDIFLGHDGARWEKGPQVHNRWRYQPLRGLSIAPNRVLFRAKHNHQEPALFVMVEKTRNIGRGEGRTAYGKLLELLRAKNVKLGLLTNGRQFRLCYAGLDFDSWVEWDVESWFAEGEWRQQLYGFYTLLSQIGLGTGEVGDQNFPLLTAADSSRTRQGDLSIVLGEQVREAVELLLRELNQSLRDNPELLETVRQNPFGGELSQQRMLEALYQASVRMIMRLVVIFFAEARDLLPRSMSLYYSSYSLEGLYEQLRRAVQYEGNQELDGHESAWTRLLGLFQLIYEGSSASILPVPAYGGLLFRPGDVSSRDATLRAVALFEDIDILSISDAAVLRLLKLLKNGKIKIKQGRTSRSVAGPVDFSELRTEYIGLMYQGLLDFRLHETTQPMIFLNLGQQPVLPLQVLEDMSDTQLKELLKKLSSEKGNKSSMAEGEEEVEEAEPETVGAIDEGEIAEEVVEEAEEEDELAPSAEEELTRRVYTWAERAVELAGLVKKPKGKQKDALYLYDQERAKRSRDLIKITLDQNEFYLIRRGGTRKGSGTFYTRPQLSVPVTWRTLEPLAYFEREDGTKIPRTPQEILDIKVCDPACGSASFLVAALHYLTDALYASLIYYHHIDEFPRNGLLPTLPAGIDSRALYDEELLPTRPNDKNFENRVKASLRRYVVERCIYGVDLSPLAVELARMSLWIETMNGRFPFTFLDHKIKVGNALVGAWFDTFREYPIMAWKREGGDASHTNGVHYKVDEWTKALNKARNEVIKPALIQQIESSSAQLFLWDEEKQETPEHFHTTLTAEFEQIHLMPVETVQEREERYLKLQETPGYRSMKQAFNAWCALWFWPADQLDTAPAPDNFYTLSPETQDRIAALADELHFFHWELEFPEVFRRPGQGFDAMLANPPWETSKPSSFEFFSDYDPLYRTYGKQEALGVQKRLFAQDGIEHEWLSYQAHFKGMSNWVKRVVSPFGDPLVNKDDAFSLKTGKRGAELHAIWRKRRALHQSIGDPLEPFRYQGSADLNTYKLFLEVTHHLLRKDGHMGLVVPSGLYTDYGSVDLRKLFLDNCNWSMLFCFINSKNIFSIHSAFKFVALQIQKGGTTEQLQVTFNQQALAALEQPEQHLFAYPRKQVERFSPNSLAIIELQTDRDLAILEKLYSNTVLLGDQSIHGWQIQYATEFHMTNDSALFPPITKWQEQGYCPDGYGRWIDDDGNVALPLYEGRMVGAFDPSEKGWVSGKGRSAVWWDIVYTDKVLEPQYLLSLADYKAQEKILPGYKIGFMDIGSATNTRSMYSTFINDMPSGHTVSVVQPRKSNAFNNLALISIFNSLTYDYLLRSRLGGLHLSLFIIEETPLVFQPDILPTICAQLAARLNLIMPGFAPQWLEMRATYPALGERHWRKLWAITAHERLRLRCILDAIIAELYGLDYDDLAWILRDDRSNQKGFWRVDKEKPQELRQTTLTLMAFKRLKEVGLEAFQQEDWQFSEEIAAQLGPRFTPWQEEGTIEESWEECEQHAQHMKELLPPEAVSMSEEYADSVSSSTVAESALSTRQTFGSKKPMQKSLFEAEHEQLDLWGE